MLGAGYAGLAAANELILRGHDVTLIEGRALLGGRAHSFVDTKSGLVLDNGQHILMGCYPRVARVAAAVGCQRSTLFAAAHGRCRLSAERAAACWLRAAPEPLHLLSALLGYKELNSADKFAAIKLALRMRLGQGAHANESVEVWMRRWGQTPNIIRALWEPLCIAALNEPVATASATLFATVIRRSFLAGAADASILLSRVGLSELFAPETRQLIEMCRSTIRVQVPVTGLRFEGTTFARN